MTQPKDDKQPLDKKAQDSVDAAADTAHDAVTTTADAVSDAVGHATDAVSEAVKSATRAADDAVDTVHQTVSSGLHQATKTSADISGRATAAVKNYPARTVLIVVVGAAIAGFIAGAVMSKRS